MLCIFETLTLLGTDLHDTSIRNVITFMIRVKIYVMDEELLGLP